MNKEIDLLEQYRKETGDTNEACSFSYIEWLEAKNKELIELLNKSVTENDDFLESICEKFGKGNGAWIAVEAIGMYKKEIQKAIR